MYEQFFGFRELPFELTPNPRFLFLTHRHREALTSLRHGISTAKGIVVLIGEAGTGKTTIVRTVLDEQTEKLLPVVLAGQPELAGRLNEASLRQLKQRIALRCDLAPLTLQETASYIAARIRIAGGDSARVFTREAVMLIHERSGGIPRVISVICDNA